MKQSRILVVVFAVASIFLYGLAPLASAIPADTAAGSTLQQRIAQRKSEQTVSIDEKLKKRLESRCVQAQATLRSMQSQIGTTLANRTKVYQQIDGKMWVAIGQLKLAEKDTFNFEAQRKAYEDKVAAFETTANQYKQTIDDIIVIDCKSDLTGFVALVQTAREYHQELRKQSADIRAYTVDTIKATLSSLASEL